MPKVAALFEEALAKGASDLHLGPGNPPMVRVQGALSPLREDLLEGREIEALCLEILPQQLRGRFSSELEIAFAHAHRDGGVRARAAYFVKNGGLGAAFRFVPPKVPSLAELGAPEVLWRLLDTRGGLLLVAGGAGSGRSTTAAAMVAHLDQSRSCHIVTLDEPIEYVHEGTRSQITQREIGPHAVSLPHAMKNALRDDVDVLVIGDLPMGEPMKLALDLATSGIFVIAVVHASGAIAAVERLLSSFPPEEQPRARNAVESTLVGVVAQQLVKPTDAKKRIAIHELLVMSPAIAASIREGKTRALGGLLAAGSAQGMTTFEVALEKLLVDNRLSPEAAYERALDKDAFTRVLARVRPDLGEQG